MRDGGRGARRQSLGTEPGMPSLEAKQEHGEPSRECLLATTEAAASASRMCSPVAFIYLCSHTSYSPCIYLTDTTVLGMFPNAKPQMQHTI